MAAYYNEIDPFAAQWLRNLITAGYIAPGEVDERSVEDVRPSDLAGFAQVHFFAGIGVWSLALRRAGWPDDRPVWTGSCPCQPFSAAGAGAGFADERHLWPAMFHLIEQCRPATVFGEQVASKDADPWIDLVQTDLEGVGYAIGAVAFPAASVGASHIRDRLYWVANTKGAGSSHGRTGEVLAIPTKGGGIHVADGMADTSIKRCNGVNALLHRTQSGRNAQDSIEVTGRGETSKRPGSTKGFWRDADWLLCRDGKWRPVEPGTFPLAHGASFRVGRLRAYGNAIVAPQAKIFIEAYLSTINEHQPA